MADFPFDIVLFDLDGTLVDSNRDLTPAINHALAIEGRPAVSPEDARHFIGGGAVKMLERALESSGGAVSPERLQELSTHLLEHYWAHIADNTVPFPGCIEALDVLEAKGCKLAVCTNKLEGPARMLLEKLGMDGRFAVIHGGDTFGHANAKPKPDMLLDAVEKCGGGRFAMIGDSSYDTRAGRAAGATVVALSFGYNDVPVAELDCDVMIDHFDQLVDALERL